MPEQAFDHRAIEKAIKEGRGELLADLRKNVRKSLKDLSPSRSLTLRLMRGDREVRSIPPAASPDYAGALINFCLESTYDGYDVDSKVTPLVSSTVERTLAEFFSSKKMSKSIADAVMKEIQTSSALKKTIKAEIGENRDWLKHEISALQDLDLSHSIAGQLVDVTAQQVNSFFQSAAGKQIILVIGKIMATSGGKVILVKTLNIVIAKVMASAAMKTALVAIIKKVGITVLIKTAVGKALVGLFAVVGLANIPVVWIILPIIAGFLVYEYQTFPEKLAQKIPGEVVSIIDSKFGELSETIARGAAVAIWNEVVNELTKVRTPS